MHRAEIAAPQNFFGKIITNFSLNKKMYIASCAPSRNRSSPKFFGQNYYKFFLKYKNVNSFMCTEQKSQLPKIFFGKIITNFSLNTKM